MKTSALSISLFRPLVVCIFIFTHLFIVGQDFVQLSKKIPQAVLPYTTPTEFLDVDLFESLNDFEKAGLIPLTTDEIMLFIDNESNLETENYFGVHRLQLTPKLLGIIYYKQSNHSDDFESSSYNFLITTYTLSGQKLATFDFIGYEWIDEQIDYSEEELEEEENFEEIEEDFEELEVYDEDVLQSEDITETELASDVLDEGYAFSTLYKVQTSIQLERKSVSYYSKNTIASSFFQLNLLTGEFEEIE